MTPAVFQAFRGAVRLRLSAQAGDNGLYERRILVDLMDPRRAGRSVQLLPSIFSGDGEILPYKGRLRLTEKNLF